MTNKTKDHGKNIFVDIAYNAFLARKYYNATQKLS